MKEGKSLTELATELERVAGSKKDFIAPAPAVTMVALPAVHITDAYTPMIDLNGARYGVTGYAHGQLAQYAGIPKAYYDRMKTEAPQLLAENVNCWLSKTTDKRMVRTVDHKVRAFLSDKFRPLDNHDLAMVALPELIGKGAEVVSCELTETRLYIKAILPNVSRHIDCDMNREREFQETGKSRLDHAARMNANAAAGFKRGDLINPMICLSNSEVGAGSLKVEIGGFVIACLNGLLSMAAFKKYHVGRGQASDAETEIRELLSTEARQADDAALWLKVRDITRAAFDELKFHNFADKLQAAATERIETGDLSAVVEVIAEKYNLTDSVGDNILKHLINGGDLSKYGMAQAVTAAAQEVEDYDLATDMERIGGQVIELPMKDWRKIAQGEAIAVAGREHF